LVRRCIPQLYAAIRLVRQVCFCSIYGDI